MANNSPYKEDAARRAAPGYARASVGSEPGGPEAPAGRAPRYENLALLYQGFLTGITRVQTGRQQIVDSAAFRKRMKDGLHEAEREAVKRGYQNEDITEASFAIVAYLDEAVLTSNDPSRTQWAKQSLQEELFGQAVAGEVFFERLEKIWARRDSPQLADLLEVYYLCLLLGYEGRYAVGPKAEIRMLMDNLRDRIDHIRGRSDALSPEGRLPAEPVRAVGADLLAQKLRIFAVAALLFALLCGAGFKLHLWTLADDVRTQVQRSRVL